MQQQQDDKTGRFLPGNSGFGGRPKGSRNKLGEQFLQDLAADWEVNGKHALTQCREGDVVAYCKIVASILPKEHLHKAADPLEDLSDDDVAVGLAAIRAARAAGAAGEGIRKGKPEAPGKRPPSPVH